MRAVGERNILDDFCIVDKDIKDAEHLRKVYPELINESEIKELKRIIRRLRL